MAPPLFRSRFFWKLFFSHALLIVLTVVALGFLVHRDYRRDLWERVGESLKGECLMLAHLAETATDVQRFPVTRARLQSIGQRAGRRITLVAPDGVVLFDSEADAATMENHIDRPEIQEALEKGFGRASRTSDTLGIEHLYVAHRPRPSSSTEGATEAAIVRIAVETDSLDEAAADVAKLIFAGGGIASLFALVLGAFMMRRIAVPLERMRSVVAALSAGDYDARIQMVDAPSRGDELGEMANALNRLGFDMSQRVADLTAGQERLRAMVAGMVEGVVAVDEDDRVTFSNHAARSLLGLEKVGSKTPLSEQTDLGGLDTLLETARASDRAAQCELEMSIQNPDAIVRAQAHRFKDGSKMGVVIVLHDLSEIRRLERVRRDFVANVSHELKTPLTSIRGYVETLLDGAIDDDENNVRFLDKIESNVLRLNHLVTDLLSLARIEATAGFFTLRPVDLHALVEEAVKRHEPKAVARDLTLRIEAGEGHRHVLGDTEALTQIVDNLVDNAIKYTSDLGEVVVRIGRDGENALLEVTDDGVGIPVDDQARIFERFYRVDKARSREVGGTGLGLSIVKHLAGAMRGKIELESVAGEGSTFRVRLPLAESGD